MPWISIACPQVSLGLPSFPVIEPLMKEPMKAIGVRNRAHRGDKPYKAQVATPHVPTDRPEDSREARIAHHKESPVGVAIFLSPSELEQLGLNPATTGKFEFHVTVNGIEVRPADT
jgi:hypothetical protein